MIIYRVTLLYLPLLLALWLVEAGVTVVFIRLILERFPGSRDNCWRADLAQAADAMTARLRSWLATCWSPLSGDSSLTYLIILMALLILHQILLALAMAAEGTAS